MPKNNHISKETAQTIFTLWRFHIPTKTIAISTGQKYHTVAMYIRGFRINHKQLPIRDLTEHLIKLNANFYSISPETNDQVKVKECSHVISYPATITTATITTATLTGQED